MVEVVQYLLKPYIDSQIQTLNTALTTKTATIDSNMGIVEAGNTCTHMGGIAEGQYVIWKGVLYTADSAISVGATFASSGGGKNLTACSNGGLNDVINKLPVVSYKEQSGIQIAANTEDSLTVTFSDNIDYNHSILTVETANTNVLANAYISNATTAYIDVRNFSNSSIGYGIRLKLLSDKEVTMTIN